MEKGYLSSLISNIIGLETTVQAISSLSGGCIHQMTKVITNNGIFCLKSNRSNNFLMFETESKGLELLRNTKTISVPDVIGLGVDENYSYILMEYIESGKMDRKYWDIFGRSLAILHKETSDRFGLDYNNFIGALPQKNNYHSNWSEFFIHERLLPQLKIGKDSGDVDQSIVTTFEKLFKILPDLFPLEKPALLHGDLWSGNCLVDNKSHPVLIDPAVYFGNREAEIAFTTMFGGFTEEFYQSYSESFPMAKGYKERFDIYNLYPLLVHSNLFGGGYLREVKSVLKKYS